MSELKRGCGYRKIGGLYLVSDPGTILVCDGLPLELDACPCCGFKPSFSRNLQRLQGDYIIQAETAHHGEKECQCSAMCPVCTPKLYEIQGVKYGLMFVGKKNYTPNSFIKEAFNMGVSKRIPEIPAWLKLAETWILLAHQKVPNMPLTDITFNGLNTKEPEYIQAIFYAFKPQRVEMPLWKGSMTHEQILKLEEQGITPIFLDPTLENKKKHGVARDMGKNLEKFLALEGSR